jgi:bifunctional ADP-heptose synthase (sugar kinase/adenylyltransferase)
MALVSGATVRESATLANYAGGIVCSEVGIVPIEKELLLQTILQDINNKGGR